MSKFALVAAVALATTTLAAEKSDAATVVTGGDVTLTLTYDLAAHNLWGTAAPGAHPATLDDVGNPVLKFDIQASRLNRAGTAWSGGSQIADGGYELYLNGGVYLFPTIGAPTHDGTGAIANELEDWNDDGTRACCRNEISRSGSGPNGFGVSTVGNRVFGNINGESSRDGNPDNTLFTLVASGVDSYDLVLTPWMAGMLNYAYSEWNSQWFTEHAAWAAAGGTPFSFQGGEVIGRLSVNVLTGEVADPAPVPVPAALPLLVGGLGMMGAVARRRRKAA